MVRIDKKARRAYVLDTNVLIHDPSCLFKFKEHSVIIPMTVLEELDQLKRGNHDTARSARQATRTLGALLDKVDMEAVVAGVPLEAADGSQPGGRLFFPLPHTGGPAPGLDARVADNRIIAEAQLAQQSRPDETVILVSKDVNLRVKCAALGIPVEDYRNDRVVDDIEAMSSGMTVAGSNFWERNKGEIESWQEAGRAFYRLRGDMVREWYPGLLVCETDQGGNFEGVVRSCDGEEAVLELCRDFRAERHAVWGVNAHNVLQNFAFNLLLDEDTDLVTLAGPAGTGKTYMALAAGLHQLYEERRFERIVITRETIAMGEEIGFLPGTEEEKMAPWMGGIQDNLDSLLRTDDGWASAATRDMLSGRLLFRSLGFMRGRTFNDTYLIIDEAQNLSPKQIKNLVTRAGSNTKIVCLGNVNQIDSPYLTETTSGLTYLVQRFRSWAHAAHVTLREVERSRLALAAEDLL
ncbi:MAG: PhoH family protein [Ectothiorhodospiraceae bacterium]|nr:PhoH family protein [Ectothiorhodospiraceae bacterium]